MLGVRKPSTPVWLLNDSSSVAAVVARPVVVVFMVYLGYDLAACDENISSTEALMDVDG